MLKLSKLILYHFLFVLLSLAIEFQSASSMLNWWNTEGQNSSTIHVCLYLESIQTFLISELAGRI